MSYLSWNESESRADGRGQLPALREAFPIAYVARLFSRRQLFSSSGL